MFETLLERALDISLLGGFMLAERASTRVMRFVLTLTIGPLWMMVLAVPVGLPLLVLDLVAGAWRDAKR